VQGKADYVATVTTTNIVNGKEVKTTTPAPTVKFTTEINNWLNAYNAPHWVNYAGVIEERLGSAWVNKTTVDPKAIAGTEKMGTSWVFDLMLASKDAAKAQGRKALWFNGTGSLGTQLNMGINTAYISKPGNQDKVNGKDKVLGVIPRNADNSIPNAQAFTGKQWNLANATAMAAKLKNPTVDTPYIGKTANVAGENQQDQALLDFLSVFATTQSAGKVPAKPNGYWDGIAITNQSADDAIKKALFGDGTQGVNGLIDSKNILLGGNSNYLGDAMTIDMLSSYMDTTVDAAWLQPLKSMMTAFNINKPMQLN
jgi:hypothetical protein